MKTELQNMKRLFINTSSEQDSTQEEFINKNCSQFNENYNQLVANFKASLAH
jgi:hypothetical protein|uniref:hypothetical protein n=1 Tax=Polaribacter sp. TaxID=1920175 RepID=UPI00404797DE